MGKYDCRFSFIVTHKLLLLIYGLLQSRNEVFVQRLKKITQSSEDHTAIVILI